MRTVCANCPEIVGANCAFIWAGVVFWVGLPFMISNELFCLANPPAPYSIQTCPESQIYLSKICPDDCSSAFQSGGPKFVKVCRKFEICPEIAIFQIFDKFFLTHLGPPDWNPEKQSSGQIFDKFGVRGIFECCKGPKVGNIPVTTTTKIFSKVLQYKWEAYCDTNGRSTDSISLSLGPRGTKSTAIQMGGVLRYKWEVHYDTFLGSSGGWGFRHSSEKGSHWKDTKEYLNQRGTKIRVFRVFFRAPFLPPFSHHFPPPLSPSGPVHSPTTSPLFTSPFHPPLFDSGKLRFRYTSDLGTL